MEINHNNTYLNYSQPKKPDTIQVSKINQPQPQLIHINNNNNVLKNATNFNNNKKASVTINSPQPAYNSAFYHSTTKETASTRIIDDDDEYDNYSNNDSGGRQSNRRRRRQKNKNCQNENKKIDNDNYFGANSRVNNFDRNKNSTNTNNTRRSANNKTTNNNNYNRNNLRDDTTWLSLKFIENLLEKTPEKIVLSLLDPQFERYFDAASMGDKMVFKLIKLIEKAFECNSIKTRLKPKIERIVESKFFTYHVVNLLFDKNYDNNDDELRVSLLNLAIKFMHLNPHCYVQLTPLIDSIEEIVLSSNNVYFDGYDYYDQDDQEVENLLSEVLKTKEYAIQRVANYRFRTVGKLEDHSALPPPNDFTMLSIVPQLSDILFNNEQYLRKNIIKGSYDNVNHYLDVQFRLLREDFMLPLREGVSKLRDMCKHAKFNGYKYDCFTDNLFAKVVIKTFLVF